MLLIPISVLIATLVTFGLLEKTNQMVALKACGISVHRVAAPVFVVAFFVSALVFVVQDHILPYANQRQDNLRNVIKGRPVQTHYQHGRNWIFGQENRLYHYNYFDSARNMFAGVSVYELDIGENTLSRLTYAQKAEWNPTVKKWEFYNRHEDADRPLKPNQQKRARTADRQQKRVGERAADRYWA